MSEDFIHEEDETMVAEEISEDEVDTVEMSTITDAEWEHIFAKRKELKRQIVANQPHMLDKKKKRRKANKLARKNRKMNNRRR